MLRAFSLAAACSAGALIVAAPATRPDQAAHERHVAEVMETIQSRHRKDGAHLLWLVAKGVDSVRTGRFEEGVLSSTYHVDVVGVEVARCDGALGMVWCRRVGLTARGG